MSNSTADREMSEDLAASALIPENGGAPLIKFTPSALEKISSLLQEEQNPALALRIFVTGGGCSGLQYGFTFEEVTNMNEDDYLMEIDV